MARKCANWLASYINYTKPKSEAPNSFLFWSGLFALSCAAKRNIFIPSSLLGGWKNFPNLFVFFVAPAGLRKTSTMDYLDDLFDQVPGIKSTLAPSSATQESLMQFMHDADKKAGNKGVALSILSKEFGNLYKSSTTKMIEFLVAAFDGNKVFSHLTKGGGLELVHNPSVNLLAATTPSWIATNFDTNMLEGGFASRVIWVFENKPRRYQMFYAELDQEHFNQQKLNLIEDLNHIETTLKGEINIAVEDREFIESWYKDHAQNKVKFFAPVLAGYAQRKPKHLLTIATLLHIAESDDLIITKTDFLNALAWLEKLEPKMPTIFQSIGRNTYSEDQNNIKDFILENSPVKRIDVLRRFQNAGTPEVIAVILNGLRIINYITYDQESDTFSGKQ